MAARPTWKGYLKISLVNIPVRVFPATDAAATISFNQLHKECRTRIQQKRWCPTCEAEVPNTDLVKGYEFAKGQFVVLTPEDFERAALEKDRVIDIQDFVQADAVDDRYFDKPYYLLPGKGGDKAYALLREAIRESGRIGVAKFVLRSKQRLAAIEAIGELGEVQSVSRTRSTAALGPAGRSFANAALLLRTNLDPHALLGALKVRPGVRVTLAFPSARLDAASTT